MPPSLEEVIPGFRILSQEEWSLHVSLVVRVREKGAVRPLTGSMRMSVRDKNGRILTKEEGVYGGKNIEGDYLFFHLVPEEEYYLVIDCEGYQHTEQKVKVPKLSGDDNNEPDDFIKGIKPDELIRKVLVEVELERKSRA